jgi:hypothetical protein
MNGFNLLTRYYMGCGECTKRPYELYHHLEADSRSASQETF